MSISTALPVASGVPTRLPLGPLLLLGLGVFVTVTAESLPAGLLPEMAAGLGVDPERIGLLISVWALTVIVTSIPLARATARFDRRLVVGASLGVFALANAATALAPDYAFAVGTRVAAAVAHGVFWAVVIVYATSLLAPSHLGRGLAIVTAGGTAATVAGLPAATILAQLTGWRGAFAVLGLGALALAVVIVARMPALVPARESRAERVERAGQGGLSRDRSLPALAVFGVAAVLIALAQFTSFTYIRPYLEGSASIGIDGVAALLFVYGAAGLVGVAVAGPLADRFPRSSLVVILAVYTIAFGALTFAAASTAAVVAALVVWGFAIGAVFPLLQSILMRAATARTRTLASAGMVVLFNVGIAFGPWIGGAIGGAESPTATTALSAVAMLVATGAAALGAVLAFRTRGAAGR